MPVLVIREMGKPARQVEFEENVATIGRAQGSTLRLADSAVSRVHATLREAAYKQWVLQPAGPRTPVRLDGIDLQGMGKLREGSDIFIGPIQIIFSLRSDALAFYQGKQLAQRDPGELSGIGRRPGPLVMARDTATPEAATAFMDADSLRAHHERLRAAENAWIQNVTPNPEGRIETFHLEESRPCLLGKGAKADLPLKGFTLGSKPDRVVWEGDAYVVQHRLWLPRLLVNGARCQEARLADGDLIQLGPNIFRFRTR